VCPFVFLRGGRRIMTENIIPYKPIKETPDTVHGRLLESLHISGYSFERASQEFEWLITENRWKTIGPGFENIDDFIATIDFEEFKITIEKRVKIAKMLADLRATQRAIAKMLGVGVGTINRDLDVPNGTEQEEKPLEIKDEIEENVPSGTEPETTPLNQSGVGVARMAIKKSEREIKNELQKQKNEELRKELKPLQGSYSVIVIDPPWPIKKIERDVALNQTKELDYPTMSIDQIKEFIFPCKTTDDAHLFLWTTHKFLPVSFEIIDVWCFRYVCTFVWHKPGGFQPFGLPQYNCEFCLYARKGAPEFIELKDFPTCFTAPRRGHSKKPLEFYETVKRVTKGNRVDIFNREEIPGFDAYGYEA
jgi:N6-adenosine-specific RNA methylase IME4